jgi:LmbE family N-acetylglucosaminyl deacetylase
MASVAILSPHFDDAVLSCWTVLTSPADVVVVNVFGGAPSAGAAPGWWDHHLGQPAEAIRTRAGEDRRALARAGRSARNLDFVDAQYRGGREPDGSLRAAIEDTLPPGATVYAPASLGVHPDHVAVRAAALELWHDGTEVVLYADLPHASLRGWPAWVAHDGDEAAAESWRRTLAGVGLDPDALVPRVSPLGGDELARKLEAVRQYESQLPGFEAMFRLPLDHADTLGYEVEWGLPPASAASSSPPAAARKPAAS